MGVPLVAGVLQAVHQQTISAQKIELRKIVIGRMGKGDATGRGDQ
jgi:hypothetical protein